MPAAVAESGACVVLTHSLHPPRSEPVRPVYDDVVDAVRAFLQERVARALDAGVPGDRILVDPGHDLNKNTLHSLELTRRLPEIVALGYPTLVALSNKDFVGETLDRPQRGDCPLARRRRRLRHRGRPRRARPRRAADGRRGADDRGGARLREPAYAIHNNGAN